MLIDEDDGRFYIGDSGIAGAGNGLFARVSLSRGDRLEVIGVLVKPARFPTSATTTPTSISSRVEDRCCYPAGLTAAWPTTRLERPTCKRSSKATRCSWRPAGRIGAGEELFLHLQRVRPGTLPAVLARPARPRTASGPPRPPRRKHRGARGT